MEYIKNKLEEILGCKTDYIRDVDNVPNNTVFRVSAGNKDYILKLYRSKDWPEDGKLIFVNRMLLEHDIRCAKLVSFERNPSDFPYGYLLEETVPGICADQITFDLESEKEFYIKLAKFTISFHNIPVQNYGYIGNGKADHCTLLSFFEDEYDSRAEKLAAQNIYQGDYIERLKELFFFGLKEYSDLPSVLCHGDLSKKNVIVNDLGEITLIDWDDAIAFNWMADISRMTFFMKMTNNEPQYSILRKVFLDNYDTPYRKDEFDSFEKAFHIWVGLDSLVYFIDIGNEDMKNKIIEYLKVNSTISI